MSVTLGSLYLTVHLFGYTTTERAYTKYENWNQCVNSLEIKAKSAQRDPNNQVTFEPKNGYLAIGNESTYKVEKHMCREDKG